MLVQIVKINSGVRFTVLTKQGKLITRENSRTKAALVAARDWYHEQVNAALVRFGISTTGYGLNFIRGNFTTRNAGIGSIVIDLEPWGFAEMVDGNPTMGDTGSTPTSGRAKHLLAYQDPLPAVKEGQYTVYKIVKEFS